MGFICLITPSHRDYLGGDSGYGPHFREIVLRFGKFDLAILECGQYKPRSRDSSICLRKKPHRLQLILNAKTLLPSHNSKFKLAHHAWNDPLIQVSKSEVKQKSYRLLTPMIGQKVETDNPNQTFERWWE